MTWVCPDCKKEFRNTNQWHSCARVALGDHLAHKSVEVVATVDELIGRVREFGLVTINPVKTSIQVKAKATFLSLKVKKNHVEIEFQMADRGDEAVNFPVYQSMRISRNRLLHCAVLEGPEDVTLELVGWLRDSYELVKA